MVSSPLSQIYVSLKCAASGVTRGNNPLRKKELTKKIAAKKGMPSLLGLRAHIADICVLALQESTSAGQQPVAGAAPSAAANRKIVQMPDEYLPPNKILFIQNLPDTITKEALEALFKQYVLLLFHIVARLMEADDKISCIQRSANNPRKEKHCFRRICR